jgi:hypothetical protein
MAEQTIWSADFPHRRVRLKELGLVADGHGGFGGSQGIVIDCDNGAVHGASDLCKDLAAVGYESPIP